MARRKTPQSHIGTDAPSPEEIELRSLREENRSLKERLSVAQTRPGEIAHLRVENGWLTRELARLERREP